MRNEATDRRECLPMTLDEILGGAQSQVQQEGNDPEIHSLRERAREANWWILYRGTMRPQ